MTVERCFGTVESQTEMTQTEMLLGSAGHGVLLVDRSQFPSDTMSTHAIARCGGIPATYCQLGQSGLGGRLENRDSFLHFGPNETFCLIPLTGSQLQPRDHRRRV